MDSNHNAFTIKQAQHNGQDYLLTLSGNIDAHAGEVLQTVAAMPEKARVLLDFSQVSRVNSMGLSLLLKLFEQWERRQIGIEVQNLDRMVSMLFKITGLGRFIRADGNAPGLDNVPLPHPEPAKARAEARPAAAHDHNKWHFVANLQTGQQLTGWYLLNTYLQRRLKKAIHFEQVTETPNPDLTDLLFAKPFAAALMIKRHGFIPVMRPIGECDEVVLLTRADDRRPLADYAGACVSTASADSFVYLLGRFLCDENQLPSAQLSYDFAGNEIKALQTLIRKKADMAFMLKKTYDSLSSFSKNSVRKLDESRTDFACHLFLAAPHLHQELDGLAEVLADMAGDEQGRQVLGDIQLDGFAPPDDGEINMLQMVYDRYQQ